jgi:heme oxygenase (biliverdin-IX-beta and delta-forming)
MSFLSELKEETTESHRGMEKRLDLEHRVQTEDDYRILLTRYFTLYEPLEAALGRAVDWPALGWDFQSRLKVPLLRQDLADLGVDAAGMAAWTRCAALPPLESDGAAVGCLYVLESSTLGGQILSRQFSDRIGIPTDRGGRFFRGFGPATMAHWRTFGLWSEQQAEAGGDLFLRSAVRTAAETFRTFSRWLT